MAAARGRAEGAALTQHVRIVSSAAAPEIDDDVYRGIVEQSLQGVLIFQDDRLVYSNPAITRISGYSADELRTFGLEALRERLHPDDRDRIWRQLEARLAGGGPSAPSELRFLRKDGAWRWVELLAHPLVHRGRPALQVSYVDVTERKLAEEALRESEERFSQVFRASPQPTLITAADGTVVDVNEAWEAMAGYSREEMVGRPASEARVFADVCQIPQMVQELLDTGRVRELEVPFLSKTGDQRHGLLSAESITLGGRPCVIWQGIDFTELKRARDALRAGEARFRLLTESASEFVTEVDETGRIVYLSPTFVEHLGYGGTTYEGIPQTDLIAATIHPADAGRIVAELARVMAGEPMPPALYRMRTGGGEWRWLETTGRRLAASDGSPRVVSITRDVTARVRADEERRELAARVLRSQKLEGLGLLAGGIAHDFNNLLVAIQGNAELALAALDVGHPARTLIEDAFRAAERGAGLTRELLAYAGKARVVIEPLDLVDLARDTVQLLRLLGRGRRDAAPPGGDEPGHERLRGARRGRWLGARAHRDRAARSRRAAGLPRGGRRRARPLRLPRGPRRRLRHGRRDPRADLRPVLQHQVPRSRPRARQRARDRAQPPRHAPGGERARPRDDVPRLPSAHGAARRRVRQRARRDDRARAGDGARRRRRADRPRGRVPHARGARLRGPSGRGRRQRPRDRARTRGGAARGAARPRDARHGRGPRIRGAPGDPRRPAGGLRVGPRRGAAGPAAPRP
jgi:PAS domain S-box-containing protein